MKHLSISITAILIVLYFFGNCQQDKIWIANAPAGSRYCKIDKTGKTVIPNGRLVEPEGVSYQVAPHPFGLTLSPDDKIAVTANSGTNPLSITIIRNINSKNPKIIQVPPGGHSDRGVIESVFMGLAISPDNKTVYVAGGQANKIYMFDTQTGDSLGLIDCAEKIGDSLHTKGYIGDMVLSSDGSTIFAVDQVNFKLKIIDTKSKRLINTVPTGRYPFGITLSPDEKRVYVANVGMFEYELIKGIDHNNLKETALAFPPFAYNSEEARDGIKNDTIEIPGLGDPNVPESLSVWTIDISNITKPKVVAKIKTGVLVGELIEGIPAVGGASPNSVVATEKYVFVSNGSNDNISVIDIRSDTVVNTIFLDLDKRIDHLRGKIPFGLALSPDNKRLYIAESGINAIGVIDVEKLEVIGHIPAGWFPAKLKVSSDGKKLIIANAKGYGSGPNGGEDFQVGPEGSYIGSLMKGTVQVIDIPTDEKLQELTKQVIDNNFTFIQVNDPSLDWRKNNPIPLFPGEKESPIKHIVFISKENRTYDEILGQVKKGKGDPELARYGKNASIKNSAKKDSVLNADVMVNHLNLAEKFAIGDNFYVDSDVSADGHHWLTNTYPNEWVESSVSASYGGNRSYWKVKGTPGALSFTGAAGAIYPESYNEAGSMWDHLFRNQVDFYNFGFSIMFEPSSYDKSYTDIGMRYLYNYPMPSPLHSSTSRMYPTYNTGIPDQFRIDRFIEEFNQKWINSEMEMPSLLTVIIPNDHGAGNRPDDGYPFRESYMCDNDLAVGRIVEFLSHTPYWKNMLIVITEDDAQNGVDHIDAHRSILIVISPYVKKDYVSHVHYSFGSLFKTFWHILGLPYLNQYDATATDLADFLTDKPDFTPYNAIPVDKRIFDPEKAMDPFDKDFNWKAVEESPEMDNVNDMIKDSKEQDKDRLENRERK
jgi:YVTN family beta-propeller protein